ncbi:hypothetical protein AAH991_39410 [Microbispora sp. ZYX-F-249]|uniref:DUF4260 family protein n=1 Tax=Microbispora maris TaxID=3144104 RepID=A0ABV0B355_9ACTN
MTGNTVTVTTGAVHRRTGLSGVLARHWRTGVAATGTVVSLSLLAPLPDEVQTSVSAWSVLLAAVIYLTWGTARGELASRRLLSLQTAAVLGFGAVAVAAVAAGPDAARYVLAAGWLAHAAWDVAHHRVDRVVPRWYSEACLVSDLMIAAALLAIGL